MSPSGGFGMKYVMLFIVAACAVGTADARPIIRVDAPPGSEVKVEIVRRWRIFPILPRNRK